MLEQTAQDHRIGDVGDVEFVEAEQGDVLREIFGELRQRVRFLRRPARLGLPPGVDFRLCLQHEFVEMDAALAVHRDRVEEQVHQHAFAAPDAAVDVEALRRIGTAAGETQALFPAGDADPAGIPFQGVMEALELLRRQFLDRILVELAGGFEIPIPKERAVAHRTLRPKAMPGKFSPVPAAGRSVRAAAAYRGTARARHAPRRLMFISTFFCITPVAPYSRRYGPVEGGSE